jgi:hypothetical protein
MANQDEMNRVQSQGYGNIQKVVGLGNSYELPSANQSMMGQQLMMGQQPTYAR